MQDFKCIVVVMGVCGSGKTTLGQVLAERMLLPFIEGDDFHSEANIAKMASGTGLSDLDRQSWFRDIGVVLNQPAVLTCSALKRSYRDTLRNLALYPLIFVFLNVDRCVLMERLTARSGHFAGGSLLHSQLEILEPPQEDEASLVVGPEWDAGFIIDNVRDFAAW